MERRIADLEAVRSALGDALDAGCDDLPACAGEPRRPLPFAGGGHGRSGT
ncbi:hypothetical protein GWI34_24505 [Actinomadura sp. DSM 109109]|nr:hypothetical protein [Actinomadura lepetitiana]